MLARTPKASAADYVELLKVPAPPSSLANAEAAWNKAVAARDEGQRAHVEACRLLAAQTPGQPPQISSSAVDALGELLGPLFEAEEKALAARDVERKSYEGTVVEVLKSGLTMLCDEMSERVNEFDRLLDHGFRLDAEVRASRLRLGNSVLARVGNLRRAVEDIRRLLGSSRI